MRSVRLSVRVPAALKEKLDTYGINVSEVVRRALEQEVQRREDEALKKMLGETSARLWGRVPAEDVVAAVRESRDQR